MAKRFWSALHPQLSSLPSPSHYPPQAQAPAPIPPFPNPWSLCPIGHPATAVRGAICANCGGLVR